MCQPGAILMVSVIVCLPEVSGSEAFAVILTLDSDFLSPASVPPMQKQSAANAPRATAVLRAMAPPLSCTQLVACRPLAGANYRRFGLNDSSAKKRRPQVGQPFQADVWPESGRKA